MIFENVTGLLDRPKDENGQLLQPQIEAVPSKKQFKQCVSSTICLQYAIALCTINVLYCR